MDKESEKIMAAEKSDVQKRDTGIYKKRFAKGSTEAAVYQIPHIISSQIHTQVAEEKEIGNSS